MMKTDFKPAFLKIFLKNCRIFKVFTKENNQEVEIPKADRHIKLVLNYQNPHVNFKQQKMSLNRK